MNMKKLPVDVLIAKRRILMLCAAMVALAAMTACGENHTVRLLKPSDIFSR